MSTEVKQASLSERNRALYATYLEAHRKAAAAAKALVQAVTADWDAKYPTGVNGKLASFRAEGGRLSYDWKTRRRRKGSRYADEDPFNVPHSTSSSENQGISDDMETRTLDKLAEAERVLGGKLDPSKPANKQTLDLRKTFLRMQDSVKRGNVSGRAYAVRRPPCESSD
jgi:hypothetical protein